MKSQNREFLGYYQIGMHDVKVYLLWDEVGGSYQFKPDEHHCTMEIGMDTKKWYDVLEVIFHEVLEFIFNDRGLSFERRGKWTSNTADRHFFFDHQEFADACGRLAFTSHRLIGDVQVKWRTRNPEEVKEDKKPFRFVFKKKKKEPKKKKNHIVNIRA